MVVLNNSPEERTIELGRYAEGLKGHNNGMDILTGSSVDLAKTLTIGGKTPMVIELK
jgi:neopullulanase